MTIKLYLDNAYLKECNAKIVEKFERENKTNVILDKTVFFPSQVAGQAGDSGEINGIEVENVYEDKGKIVHTLVRDINSTSVNLKIDWEKRFDNMQQHMAEHLLTYAFEHLYKANRKNFNLGKEFSTIDLEIKNLDYNIINLIEDYVNRIVFSAFKIHSRFIPKPEAGRNGIKLSPKVTADEIRIVEIDSFFKKACLGTHLNNTGEIGLIKIIGTEEIDNLKRIKFLAGFRTLYYFREKVL
ncbi:MAG: alanyl-tRNA editing protein [Tissierellia bacterium]|nr:alanyl-tRNA editing protein [Tissierellia bacterium]